MTIKTEQNSESFSYIYSAKQQDEIKRICGKYIPTEQNKMEQLRRLDESATRPGKIISIAVGIISTLVMGFGMSCTMVWTQYYIPGIIIGVVGIVGIVLSFPIYTAVTERQRKRLAPEIIRLSKELIENE